METQKFAQTLLNVTPQAFAHRLFQLDSPLVVIAPVNGTVRCSVPELQPLAREMAGLPDYDNHEAVFLLPDNVSGTLFIVAIHNTHRGPALGGCREAPYSTVGEAVTDALRLSKGMTRKNAISDIYYGGGKGVIARVPGRDFSDPILRHALYRSWGRMVSRLKGLYITAEDMGNSTKDVKVMHEETRFAACLPMSAGGSGNPSPVTAYGVVLGMKACVKYLYGIDGLEDLKVVVQGVGNVGSELVCLLVAEGARVSVADVNSLVVENVLDRYPSVKAISAERIPVEPCHILAPCARGGVINNANIPTLGCEILCGAANNILQNDERGGSGLKTEGIVYPVDYNVNRGVVINAAMELFGYDSEKVKKKVDQVFPDSIYILKEAERRGVIPLQVADELADERAKDIHPLAGHVGSQRISDFFCIDKQLRG